MGDRDGWAVSGRTPKSGRGVPRKAPVKRVTAYVPFRLWRQFRERCETEDRSMSDVVTEFVDAWLKPARR
jgi:hypothetical protein